MKTILVVDDELGLAEALSAILSDEGFRVFCAVNGRQALQRLDETSPDLVITDLMMPILDGPGLIQELRRSEHYRALPVILMSGVSEATAREYTTEQAAFLRKPFLAAELLAVVRALVG